MLVFKSRMMCRKLAAGCNQGYLFYRFDLSTAKTWQWGRGWSFSHWKCSFLAETVWMRDDYCPTRRRPVRNRMVIYLFLFNFIQGFLCSFGLGSIFDVTLFFLLSSRPWKTLLLSALPLTIRTNQQVSGMFNTGSGRSAWDRVVCP